MVFLRRPVMIFLNTGFFRLADLRLSHNCLQRTLRKDSNGSFNEVTRNFY